MLPRPEAIAWADATFGALMACGDATLLPVFLESQPAQPRPSLTPRIERAGEFMKIMRVWEAQRTDARDRLQATDFSTLRSSFLGREPSPTRAEMLAATIRFIRRGLSPGWLTPVAVEAEALLLARRYNEAADLAVAYPRLLINLRGRRQELDELLRERWPDPPDTRTLDAATADERRILEGWFGHLATVHPPR